MKIDSQIMCHIGHREDHEIQGMHKLLLLHLAKTSNGKFHCGLLKNQNSYSAFSLRASTGLLDFRFL
jgi:hypothetical protein